MCKNLVANSDFGIWHKGDMCQIRSIDTMPADWVYYVWIITNDDKSIIGTVLPMVFNEETRCGFNVVDDVEFRTLLRENRNKRNNEIEEVKNV